MTDETRHLIVNADDFGQTAGVNRGVIEAHERGVVTSASLMVRWPAAGAAAAYARAHPALSLGLHFDLYEFTYSEEVWDWLPLYQVVPTDDAAAVTDELFRQLETFRSLVGREPTHLDSHQHVHRSEHIRPILSAAAERLGVPLRDCDPAIRYCGDFYGQTGKGYPLPERVGVEHLISVVESLPPGVTELGCHPGYADKDLQTMYRAERELEVKTLCDPRVRVALEAARVTLCSFHDAPIGGPKAAR